jgi:hypothetical protein
MFYLIICSLDKPNSHDFLILENKKNLVSNDKKAKTTTARAMTTKSSQLKIADSV